MNGCNPDVSVVVATHERADRLHRLLAALREQEIGTLEVEIVVVDDGSTDATPDVLAAAARRGDPPLRVIRSGRSEGPAAARQKGWRASRGAIVAFTDDDCRPAPGWIASGYAACCAKPTAIVQGMTLPDPDHADRHGPFSRTIEVTVPNGSFQTCNVFYPRGLLERVGGFDLEAWGGAWGGEDSDLAWRAIGSGARTTFEPAALVYHEVRNLGPLGKLRLAGGWSFAMQAYARHPGLRRAHFVHWLFWKHTHMWLCQALLALALRGRARHLRLALVLPYLQALWARGKLEGGGPWLAPYFLLHDLIEVSAVVRGGIRYRSPML